jgi:hypothetical protein
MARQFDWIKSQFVSAVLLLAYTFFDAARCVRRRIVADLRAMTLNLPSLSRCSLFLAPIKAPLDGRLYPMT